MTDPQLLGRLALLTASVERLAAAIENAPLTPPTPSVTDGSSLFIQGREMALRDRRDDIEKEIRRQAETGLSIGAISEIHGLDEDEVRAVLDEPSARTVAAEVIVEVFALEAAEKLRLGETEKEIALTLGVDQKHIRPLAELAPEGF